MASLTHIITSLDREIPRGKEFSRAGMQERTGETVKNRVRMQEIKRGWFDVLYANCDDCVHHDGYGGWTAEKEDYCNEGHNYLRPRKCDDFKKISSWKLHRRDLGYFWKKYVFLPVRMMLWPFRKLTGWYEKIQEEEKEDKP